MSLKSDQLELGFSICRDCYTSFLLICTSFMVLDLLQNFVSAQYLENKWTEFDQTLYNYLYLQDLHRDC